MTSSYVVLGDPVAHSKSPLIQQAAFDAAGLDAEYSARRVDPDGFSDAVDDMRRGELAGANVTMPHKRLAAHLADEVRGVAVTMRAANTLCLEDGRVVAISTDPDGVRYAISYGGLPEEGPVLVLGAGGAAAAVVEALRGRPLRIAARREEAARRLVVTLASDASVLEWGTGVPAALVINATPLGMSGEHLPPSVVEAGSSFLDLTYGPVESPAVIAFRARGCPTADGRAMLVGQGMASFEAWTGLPASEEAMWAALPTAESG